jgi:hypothetical protein
VGLPSAASLPKRIEAFRAGLRDLGYQEGRDIVIEYRWADGRLDQLPAFAAELVRLKVDVIVTHGIPGHAFGNEQKFSRGNFLHAVCAERCRTQPSAGSTSS